MYSNISCVSSTFSIVFMIIWCLFALNLCSCSARPEIPCRAKMANEEVEREREKSINSFMSTCSLEIVEVWISYTGMELSAFHWSNSHDGRAMEQHLYRKKILRCSKRNYLLHFTVDLGCQVQIWSRSQSLCYVCPWLSAPHQAVTKSTSTSTQRQWQHHQWRQAELSS